MANALLERPESEASDAVDAELDAGSARARLNRSRLARLPAIGGLDRIRVPHLWTMGLALLFAAMFASVVVHGHLAGGQARLDDLDRQIGAAERRSDQLRREVARLEAPDRIGQEAARQDMAKALPRSFLVPIGSGVEPRESGLSQIQRPEPEEALSEPLIDRTRPNLAPEDAVPAPEITSEPEPGVETGEAPAARTPPAGPLDEPAVASGGEPVANPGEPEIINEIDVADQPASQPILDPTSTPASNPAPAPAADASISPSTDTSPDLNQPAANDQGNAPEVADEASTPLEVPTRTVVPRAPVGAGDDQQLSSSPPEGNDS